MNILIPQLWWGKLREQVLEYSFKIIGRKCCMEIKEQCKGNYHHIV